jgi:multidrug efflux pump subunit AcrA (membrane-fusion protein)
MKFKEISKNVLLIIFVTVITFMPEACKSGNENQEVESAGSPVQITSPVVKDMEEYLELNATTMFLNKEIVRATFQGFIQKTYKNIGDPVKQGEIIFQLRTKELASTDTMKMDIGGVTFQGSIYIKAKTQGVLTELDYHMGDFVSDGEQLAVISNPSSLVVKLSVPFENVSKLNLNYKCEIFLPGGEKVNGIIQKKVPSVDSGTQTQTFLIGIAAVKQIPENLNVIVKIPIKVYKDAIALPKSSLLTDVTENNFWVMKLFNDTTAIRVNIKKGIESDSMIQILDPKLNASDRIISNGAYGLPDTAKVEIGK